MITKNHKAFLFDLNGTMIDDMPYHIKAWHRILNKLGTVLTIEEVKEQCYGKNHELLERIFPGRFSEAEKDKISLEKETQYQQEFRPHLQLINGLNIFLKRSHDAGIKMAIGSAAIMFNINFVLDGLSIRKYFDAIVSADDVKLSKPHPETWLTCVNKLNIKPDDCVVFEDTPKGAESAMNAGIQCIIITTLHQKPEFSDYENVIGFISDFEDPLLYQLLKLSV